MGRIGCNITHHYPLYPERVNKWPNSMTDDDEQYEKSEFFAPATPHTLLWVPTSQIMNSTNIGYHNGSIRKAVLQPHKGREVTLQTI